MMKSNDKSANNLLPNSQVSFLIRFKNKLSLNEYCEAKNILKKVVDIHIAENIYPTRLGSILFDCIISCPTDDRSYLDFPLIDHSTCNRLAELANEENLQDAQLLYMVSSGENIRTLKPLPKLLALKLEPVKYTADSSLSFILNRINENNLTKKIGIPIDTARASFALDQITVSSANFSKVLPSFYQYLSSSRRDILNPNESEAMSADAFALLERAFADKGGVKAAYAEAEVGVNGGLRYIFDAMANQFKFDEKENYVNHVFKIAIDPLEWKVKVELIVELLKKLKSNLPQELSSQPPEKYATNWEVIVKAYVQSISNLNSLLRCY